MCHLAPVRIVVQFLSHVWLFATPWTAACQASLSFTVSWSLLRLMSIELVMSSNHLILCYPLLLPPSIFPSIRAFSNESVLCIRWPKYWNFGFNISPSNEYSGLISLRIDWLDLLAVQGTLKSLLQQHSSKASILWHSAFLTVQLSHPYMTTGKTIALTRWTFVGKVMSLFFNMQKGTCTSMFIAALLTIAKTSKQTKRSSTDKWVEMSYTHTHTHAHTHTHTHTHTRASLVARLVRICLPAMQADMSLPDT